VNGWLRHQDAADELRSYNILWTDKACVTCEGVFLVHNSRLWTHDDPHVIRERGYCVLFSGSVWTGIVGPRLLPDRLTAQRYRAFLANVLLALRQTWFLHDGAPAHCGEEVRQRLNTTCGWDADGWLHGLLLIARSTPTDFFLLWHVKDHVYTVPARTTEDIVTRLEAVVTTDDTNMLRRVPQNACCNYEAPDSLRHLTVTHVMKTCN
jgi:hypothetical protein